MLVALFAPRLEATNYDVSPFAAPHQYRLRDCLLRLRGGGHLEEIDCYTASNLFLFNLGSGHYWQSLSQRRDHCWCDSMETRRWKCCLMPLGGDFDCSSFRHTFCSPKAGHALCDAFHQRRGGRVANRAVAILQALRGWGYWSLVAGNVAATASVTVGAL